jgi:hypothetical protein
MAFSTLDFSQKTPIFSSRIQCPIEKMFKHSITFCPLIIYAITTFNIAAHVTIMTPIYPHQSPFFRLIRTPIITIDWVL